MFIFPSCSLIFIKELNSMVSDLSYAKVEDERPCLLHKGGRGCKKPAPGFIDILYADAPCQSYTSQRGNRTRSDPRDHAGYPVMFAETGSVLSLVDALKPGLLMSENVKGFEHPYTPDDPTTPQMDLEYRLQAVMSMDGKSRHFAATGTITSDPLFFVKNRRERLKFNEFIFYRFVIL